MNQRILRVIITLAVLLTVATASFGQTEMTIERALETALSENPSLLAARAQRDAAQASVGQATGRLLPQLHANASYMKYQEPNVILPIHEIGTFPPLDNEIYDANLRLAVPLFDGGRRWASRSLAKATVREVESSHQMIQIATIEQVASIYLSVHQATDQIQLVSRRLEALQVSHTDLQELNEAGRISQGDLALIRSLIASTRSDSIALSNGIDQLTDRLARLIGSSDPIRPIINQDQPSHDDLWSEYPLTKSISSISSSPLLKIAKSRQDKSKALRSLARRSFWPDISLVGAYVYRSGSDWDPVGEWTAGLSLSLPIFEGGSKVAKIKEANAVNTASIMAVKSAYLEQSMMIKIAYNEYVSLRNRFELITDAVDQKELSVESYRELYRAGRIPLRDLQTQELELLQLQLERNALVYSAHSALLSYEAATGQLTKEKAIIIAGGSQ